MAGLESKKIKDSYKSLIRVDDDTNGLDGSLANITDGKGTTAPFQMSQTAVEFTSGTSLTLGASTAFNTRQVNAPSGTLGLLIDFSPSDTGLSKIKLGDNLADALNITEDTNSYLKFVTTNGSEKIVLGKDVEITGDLTANNILGDINFDSNTLFIDESENRVGIGLNNPAKVFHVETSVAGDFISRIKNTDSTNGEGLQIHADNTSSSHRALDVRNSGGQIFGVFNDGNIVIKGDGSDQTTKWHSGSAYVNAKLDVRQLAIAFSGTDKVTSDTSGNFTFKGSLLVNDNDVEARMTTAGSGIRYIADRVDNNDFAGYEMQTGGSQRWFIGMRELTDDNLYFFNGNSSGTVQNVLTLDHSNSTATFANQIKGADGSQASPEYSFTNNTDMGMYRGASNTLRFATGGTERIEVQSSQTKISTPVKISHDTYPQLTIDGTDNSGNIGINFIGSGSRGGIQWNGSNNNVEILREDGTAEILVTYNEGTTFAGPVSCIHNNDAPLTFKKTTNGEMFIKYLDQNAALKGAIIYRTDSNQFSIRTDNTTALTIDSSQNSTFDGNITVDTGGTSIITADGNNSSGDDGRIILKGHTSGQSRAYAYFNNGVSSGGLNWYVGCLRGSNAFSITVGNDDAPGYGGGSYNDTVMIIDGNRKIGIGGDPGSQKVRIIGDLYVDSNSQFSNALIGNVNIGGVNYAMLGSNSTTRGIALCRDGSASLPDFRINGDGSAQFNGSVSKGSGSFKIDHPLPSKKDTHYLVHSFTESPRADLIYRDKVTLVKGKATINIDEVAGMTEGTFVLLCDDVQCFTSNESDWDAVKGSVEGNILTIECQNSESTANVSWMVIADRKDQHMIDTNWTDENGKPIIEPLKETELENKLGE